MLFVYIHDNVIFSGEMNHIYGLNFLNVKKTVLEKYFADVIKHQSYIAQVISISMSNISFIAWRELISITFNK